MKKLILIIALLANFTSSFAILPERTYIRHPEKLGLIYKELNVVTKDNYTIKTWFFPAQHYLSDDEFQNLNGAKRPYATLDKTKRPTIIICNGDAGNMSYFQLFLAEGWTAQGFNVVTFDWRGFGKSTPFTMNHNYLCYTEMLEDYRAVIEEVSKQKEVQESGITICGWSTGSYLSMITANRNSKVKAFIGRSLPTDFDDFIPLVMNYKGKTRDELLIPNDFPKAEMPIYIAPKFHKPIFLIVGENDFRTPVWMSEKLIKSLPKTTPRELMIVKNAAHGGKEDPMIIEYDNFIENTSIFLKKNL